jgi:hypothetical protein
MRRLAHRVAKLEARREAEAQQPRTYVVWLGPDGLPEDMPVLQEGEQYMALPRKCRSVEEWQYRCAQRWNMLPPEEEAPR